MCLTSAFSRLRAGGMQFHLQAVFHQGLNPIICKELACRDEHLSLDALIDLAICLDNFMDLHTAKKIGIPLVTLNNPITIYATDGRGLGKGEITHCTVPLILSTSALHSETLSFMLTTSPRQPLILGNSWLRQHDPIISWTTGEIIKWSKNCQIKWSLSHSLSFFPAPLL